MTAIAPQPIATRPRPVRPSVKGATLLGLLQTTDHKQIGKLYLVTSFGFFIGGRSDGHADARGTGPPGVTVPVYRAVQPAVHRARHNHAAAVCDTDMFAFANLVLPLQIGAPDVAFPRLNAFSYWLFLFGGLIVLSGFLIPAGAPDFGWLRILRCLTPRTPLASAGTCGSWDWCYPVWVPSWPPST